MYCNSKQKYLRIRYKLQKYSKLHGVKFLYPQINTYIAGVLHRQYSAIIIKFSLTPINFKICKNENGKGGVSPSYWCLINVKIFCNMLFIRGTQSFFFFEIRKYEYLHHVHSISRSILATPAIKKKNY